MYLPCILKIWYPPVQRYISCLQIFFYLWLIIFAYKEVSLKKTYKHAQSSVCFNSWPLKYADILYMWKWSSKFRFNPHKVTLKSLNIWQYNFIKVFIFKRFIMYMNEQILNVFMHVLGVNGYKHAFFSFDRRRGDNLFSFSLLIKSSSIPFLYSYSLYPLIRTVNTYVSHLACWECRINSKSYLF